MILEQVLISVNFQHMGNKHDKVCFHSSDLMTQFIKRSLRGERFKSWHYIFLLTTI